jgi:Protein of unknown function (DUF3592)
MPQSPAAEPRRRYEIVAAGCLLLGIALFFGWTSLQSAFWQWQAHYEFVPVLATVQRSGIESFTAGAGSRGQTWRPTVTYQYAFGSTLHEHNRIFYRGDGWSDRAAVEDWLVNYDEGTTVTAYVNPAVPLEAVLDNTVPDNGFLLWLLPLVVAGGLAVAIGLRRRP